MKRSAGMAGHGPLKAGVRKGTKKTKGDYQKGRELVKTPLMELKAFDLSNQNLSLDPTGGPPAFVTNINAPVNGAELYQRVGRKVGRAPWPKAKGAKYSLSFPILRMEPRSRGSTKSPHGASFC